MNGTACEVMRLRNRFTFWVLLFALKFIQIFIESEIIVPLCSWILFGFNKDFMQFF